MTADNLLKRNTFNLRICMKQKKADGRSRPLVSAGWAFQPSRDVPLSEEVGPKGGETPERPR